MYAHLQMVANKLPRGLSEVQPASEYFFICQDPVMVLLKDKYVTQNVGDEKLDRIFTFEPLIFRRDSYVIKFNCSQ